MRLILIHVPGHTDEMLFDRQARDDCNEPFAHLRDRLAEMGFTLTTVGDHRLEDCERLILWDFLPGFLREEGPAPWRPLYSEALDADMRDRILLIIGEPPVVLPGNWEPATHRRFSTILTWSDQLAGRPPFRKFCWPLTQYFPAVTPRPFAQKKLLVNISGDKQSDHPQDLYRERRATIRHFEVHAPEDFDLFGVGWDAPGSETWPSYRGCVGHKWDTYPQYRFGLCYENMRDEAGWITEKIFDCMRANCVPIYWGASNIADYVELGAFIDRRDFHSNAELESFLRSMTSEEHEWRLEAIRGYLASPAFAHFLSPSFADTVIKALRLD